MRDQISDTPGLATLEAARPLSWQATAVGDYERPGRSGTSTCGRISP